MKQIRSRLPCLQSLPNWIIYRVDRVTTALRLNRCLRWDEKGRQQYETHSTCFRDDIIGSEFLARWTSIRK